jgi:transcriptional regulator of acetoin/glycerol metabolism
VTLVRGDAPLLWRRRGSCQMPKSDSPFHVWVARMSALRCRAAVVRCDGNHRDAARQIGVDFTTLWRILKRDDAMLDERAAAEHWQPPAE